MTKCYCFFSQLEANDDAKATAAYRRLNLLAEIDDLTPIIITLQHNLSQKLVLKTLQDQERLHPRIAHLSLYEAAMANFPKRARKAKTVTPFWPPTFEWDWAENTTLKERDHPFPYDDNSFIRDARFQGEVIQRTQFFAGEPYLNTSQISENRELSTFFAHGKIVGHILRQDGVFRIGYNVAKDLRFFNKQSFLRGLMEFAIPQKSICFVDDEGLAYLSRDLTTPKVLCLNADHRDENQAIIPRARKTIETFSGDLIVTSNERHRALLYQDLKITKPIAVIPPSIDPKQAKTPIPERRHLCSICNLELSDKPIDKCIEAFSRIKGDIPDVDYLIFGSGSSEPELRAQIERLGVGDRVELMGEAQNPRAIYGSSIASFYPAFAGDFGLPLLDALSNGCPVVTFDVDFGPRDFIRPGENGELVQPHDIEGLAHAVLRIIRKNEEYTAASTKGLELYAHSQLTKTYERAILATVLFSKLKNKTAPKKGPLKSRFVNADLHSFLFSDLNASEMNADLLNTYIDFLDYMDEKESLFAALLLKKENGTFNHRLLQRLVWLSHKLEKQDECRTFLKELDQLFPQHYAEFVGRFKQFRSLASSTT